MNQNSNTSIAKTNSTVYHLAKFLVVRPFFYLYFRGKVIGIEKVPRKGKLIIVSNHASVWDPPILACAIPRAVSFMAKKELFESPLFAKLITSLGAYPVNRTGGDRNAIRQAINKIEEGWATCIFIEGTRTEDGKVYDPKLGAALIAAKTQAPLLPICLCGTEKILVPDKKFPQCVPLTLKVGGLVSPPPSTKKEHLESVTQECTNAINSLAKEVPILSEAG